MTGMNITVCSREGGCKTQYGVFGDESNQHIQNYVKWQRDYMGNECEEIRACSQICGVLSVKLKQVEVPGEIITGVSISGVTLSGEVLREAPGVAYIDESGAIKTQPFLNKP